MKTKKTKPRAKVKDYPIACMRCRRELCVVRTTSTPGEVISKIVKSSHGGIAASLMAARSGEAVQALCRRCYLVVRRTCANYKETK